MKKRGSILNFLILGIIVLIFVFLFKGLDFGNLIQTVEANNTILNLLIFIFAGLVDGINPCALSMLLFFMMTMFNMNKENTNILLIGFLFALGTFIAYFAAGLGLVKIIRYMEFINYLPPIIYGITIVLSFVLAIVNFKDAYYAKKQDLKNITLQLPSKNKKIIHNLIKKVSKGRYKYSIAFVLGFLVTLGELLCTGQVYFAAMVALQNFSGLAQKFYLLVFNIGFIFPILIITIIVHKTRELMSFSDTLLNRLWIIKIITGVIMIILGLFILKEFLGLIL